MTQMSDFVEVARVEQLLPGTGKCFTVAGKNIAVFNVDGSIYAIDDTCLHKGASLGTGKLEGKVVTCRAHGWRFDVTTGSTINVPGYGVGSYPAKVVDGKILVLVA
jgi:nitrite reductase/ring-hydroxylating ferredoxin subunit